MVWRTFELLGYSIAFCDSIEGKHDVQRAVAVCHYKVPEDCTGFICRNNARGGFPFFPQCVRSVGRRSPLVRSHGWGWSFKGQTPYAVRPPFVSILHPLLVTSPPREQLRKTCRESLTTIPPPPVPPPESGSFDPLDKP